MLILTICFFAGMTRHIASKTMMERESSARMIHLQKLSTMTNDEIQSGNATECQTPDILRKAKSEMSLNRIISNNLVHELQVIKKTLIAAQPSSKVPGFIHEIGASPFHVTFYTEDQVRLFVDSCKCDELSILHLDSTGSVIKSINGEKEPFYYCLLLQTSNLPVFECLTTRHTATQIQYLLSQFVTAAYEVNNGRPVHPNLIVTDFSYALIYAVLWSFNKLSLTAYLHFTYQVLNGSATREEIKSVTYVGICCAHMIHALARQLVRCEKNSRIRKATLVMFALMQRTTHLTEASTLYSSVCCILNTRIDSHDVRKIKSDLIPKETSPIYVEAIAVDEMISDDASNIDIRDDISNTGKYNIKFLLKTMVSIYVLCRHDRTE